MSGFYRLSIPRVSIACSDRDPTCPCWVHDLAVTRNHVVIVESPMFISLPALMSMAESEYIFMDWRPEQGTRVHVVPLNESMGVSHEHYQFVGEGKLTVQTVSCTWLH